MENLVLIIVLACIVGGASIYIYKSKKRGEACIGCPHAKKCRSNKGGGCCSNKK
ncbi:MAG: hypothetical protein IKV64_04290 [Clostridia bacterium]|nr:hypothetical protein [Clostridia bacterium]